METEVEVGEVEAVPTPIVPAVTIAGPTATMRPMAQTLAAILLKDTVPMPHTPIAWEAVS